MRPSAKAKVTVSVNLANSQPGREPTAMSWLNPSYLIHLANILLLLAYTVRDILWLRVFALVSSLIAIPYFALQQTLLWEPICWSALFAAINLYQAWQLIMERRPVKLSAEEEDVRRLVFRDLPPRTFLRVLSLGAWTTTEEGERLLERGQSARAISLIVTGKVRVTQNERVLGDLGAGDLVGSALILTGTPADVDAVVVEPMRAVRWELDPLERYLASNPETRVVMQRYLARDLATKLNRSLIANANVQPKRSFPMGTHRPGGTTKDE